MRDAQRRRALMKSSRRCCRFRCRTPLGGPLPGTSRRCFSGRPWAGRLLATPCAGAAATLLLHLWTLGKHTCAQLLEKRITERSLAVPLRLPSLRPLTLRPWSQRWQPLCKKIPACSSWGVLDHMQSATSASISSGPRCPTAPAQAHHSSLTRQAAVARPPRRSAPMPSWRP